MTAFYDGKYDVLLSTTIVESGLDIPTANTLIVHRADMFGLAQLYQLRGRVGRSKMRAYALFTLPARQQDHRAGRAAAQGAAIARHARRRLPARLARSRHPRRRQSARRRAVRPHQGGRLRALPADAGRGGDVAEGRHRRAGRRPLVAADHHRHAGDDPGGLRRRPVGAARRSTGGSPTSRTSRRSRRSAPSWSTASGRCRRRSSTCSRSSPSRRCAGAPMSRRSRPGRRARCCRSATTRFANPEGLIALHRASRAPPRGCGRT